MLDETVDYTIENQYHLRRLLGSIEASYGGLNLLVCICDNPYYRDEIVEAYEQELSAKGVSCHRVQIDRHQPSLKQSLLNLEAGVEIKQPAIVTVFGIDGLLRVQLEQEQLSATTNRSEQEKFFFSVQWTREALREFKFPIILWMTESIAGELSQQAPDFWSWRGGVFEFVRSINLIEMVNDNTQLSEEIGSSIDFDMVEPSGNPEEIQAQIDKLIVIDPNSSLLRSLYLSLGIAYFNQLKSREIGSQANIESAISIYQQVLELYPRTTFPQDWASTQQKLGITYRKRLGGSRTENLALAIECFRLALEVFTRQEFPEDWAKIQGNLGNCYNEIFLGKRAENLELAIESYQLALEVFTHQDFPKYWAMTQNNLANVYSKRIQGERVENIELAIKCCRLALQVFTHKDFPEDWARTQYNLATAYHKRIRGDRINNLELAIECYHLTLNVYTNEAFPELWVIIQNHIDNICKALIKENQLAI